MQEARDRYRTGTGQVGFLEPLLKQWVEWSALLMVPITPHFSEGLWKLLGKPGCIVHARWPQPAGAEDAALTSSGEFLFDVSHSLSAALVNRDKKKKGPAEPSKKPNQVNLYVAKAFPRWKEIVLELLQQAFDPATNTCADSVMKQDIPNSAELQAFNKGKQVPQFAAMVREEAKSKGAAAFALAMPFDEETVLRDNLPYLCSTLGVAAVHLFTEAHELPEPEVMASAVPGKPQANFFFDDEMKPPKPAAGGAAAAAALPPAPAAKPTMIEYLEKHDFANVLNKAVNDIAADQPADPFAALAAKLSAISAANKKK